MDKTKNKKKESDEVLLAKLDRWWTSASNARKRIDWTWFQYDLWKEGYHYARWDRSTQQIITTPKTDGTPKVMVNKIDAALRAVVNYALRNRPKAEVTPADMSQDQINEVVKQNLFLDYLHDRLVMREKERGAVDESAGGGIAWVQVLFDEDAEDGNGQIAVNEVDKYDLYWNKEARDPKEVQYYILAVSRPINELKEDPKYKGADWEKIKPENTRSSSSLKERLLKLDTGDTSTPQDKNEGNALVKEYWYKQDGKVYVCATAGGVIIRKPELTDLDRFPFFRLCVARKKGSMVGKSWVKNLIPLNRRLNQLMSSLAEYNIIMNKGYWIADKGAGVRTINNEHGIIIEKKRGYQVAQGQVASISSHIINELQYILQLFEDISAVHDATMGRIPVGAKSGKALEALQVGDSNNLSEIVENTEMWLEEIYEYMLYLAAKKYQFARDITPVSKTGQREFIKVIGEEAQAVPQGALVIKKNNVVDVKITSYLAHTAEARREAIKELASLIPDLDPQTILEVYEVGPIADIISRIKQQRTERQAQELQQAKEQATIGQPQPSSSQQAIAIIRQVINGQIPQLPEMVDPAFVEYFDQFLSSQEAQSLDENTRSVLQQMRDQAAQMVTSGAMVSSSSSVAGGGNDSQMQM